MFIGSKEQSHNLHTSLAAKSKLSTKFCIFPPVCCDPAKRIIWVFFIQIIKFVQNRLVFIFQRWNTPEQIPQTFKMILHFTTATHYISSRSIVYTVTRSAGNIKCLKDMNIFSRHLCIPHKKACCSKCTKTTSHDVRRFFLDTDRLFWSCKCFVVAACIVNAFAVLIVFSTLRVLIVRFFIIIFSIASVFAFNLSITIINILTPFFNNSIRH